MKKLLVKKSENLSGVVDIHGSKNSVLPILIASLLVDGVIKLTNVPRIDDVYQILEIFKHLKIDYEFNEHTLKINAKAIDYKSFLDKNIEKIRASTYFMGTFLSRYKYINIKKPGGCNIGNRPIDLHIFGFKKLNAKINEENEKIEIIGDDLIPNLIQFEKKSVGATINMLLACTYIEGVSVIKNAALEIEVDDVMDFLNELGFKCFRVLDNIVIEGKKEVLKNIDLEYKIKSDRIEALTYIAFGLCNFCYLKINNVCLDRIKYPLELLIKNHANITFVDEKTLIVKKSKLTGFDVVTGEYPNFPTDFMPICGVLQCLASSSSSIKENIFENRFNSFYELIKIGGKLVIDKDENKILINNIEEFTSNNITANDLRGAAALLLAALNSKKAIINNYHYIYRGYESLIEDLIRCKANIMVIE